MKRDLICLIVEDDCDIQNFLKLVFKKKGIETHHALTLKDAKSKLRITHPDFMLIDNHLPDGSGIETIPLFRSILPNAVIIAMTALKPSQSRQDAIMNGADLFLEKPFTLNQILSLINEAIPT